MKLGIISDIHEDIIRLKEALAVLEKEKCDKIACLGDMVGYAVPYFHYLSSRNSNEVVDLIRKKMDFVVLGNHDLYHIKQIPKSKNGFHYKKNWYDLDFEVRKKFAGNKIWLYENNELPSLLNSGNLKYLKKNQ